MNYFVDANTNTNTQVAKILANYSWRGRKSFKCFISFDGSQFVDKKYKLFLAFERIFQPTFLFTLEMFAQIPRKNKIETEERSKERITHSKSKREHSTHTHTCVTHLAKLHYEWKSAVWIEHHTVERFDSLSVSYHRPERLWTVNKYAEWICWCSSMRCVCVWLSFEGIRNMENMPCSLYLFGASKSRRVLHTVRKKEIYSTTKRVSELKVEWIPSAAAVCSLFSVCSRQWIHNT